MIMKNVLTYFVVLSGWMVALLLSWVISNMQKDDEVAKTYIEQLEYAVEQDGSCAADYCDACTDYHNIFGD